MKKYLLAVAVLLAVLLARDSEAQGCFGPGCGGSGSSGSSTITSGTTATSGCVAGGVLRSISNLVECGAGLTYVSSILRTPALYATGVAEVFDCSDCYGAWGTNNLIGVGSRLVASGVGSPGVAADFSFRSAGRLMFLTGAVSHAMMDTTGAWTFGGAGTGVPVTINNGSAAVSPLVVQDNGAAQPTSGATATWNIRDGAIPQVGTGVLTSGTMTAEAQAYARGSMIHSATWSNAQVVALGAATAGDIIAFTLPAKHVVENAYVVITGQGAGTTTLTVSCGRTGAGYIDYIVASDAQAAANTVYGDASGERGTNLTGYDLPSYTGTTTVTCNFISTGANLDQVTGSTGRVVVITSLIP